MTPHLVAEEDRESHHSEKSEVGWHGVIIEVSCVVQLAVHIPKIRHKCFSAEWLAIDSDSLPDFK